MMSIAKKRWVALDFFRGITIAAMILVNNPGDYRNKFHQLGHAEWHGATLADFIFPFFLFIVGVSITLALAKYRENPATQGGVYSKILKRTLLLFLLGLVVNLLLYPATEGAGFRIAGVLQRIALVYLCCSLLFLHVSWRGLVGMAAVLLTGYWLLLALVSVPGVGHPSLEPGDNLASWFDRQFLPGLLFRGNHDPEGILSTLPAVATGITGMLAGILFKSSERTRMIRYLALAGIVLILAGIAWSQVFPFNKNLWTSSYVLLTSGAAMAVLAASTWLIDVRDIRFGVKPFEVFGSNAIAVYMLSFVFLYVVYPPVFGEGRGLIQVTNEFFLNLGIPAKWSSLLWGILYTSLCYIPIYLLYRKRIFIKV